MKKMITALAMAMVLLASGLPVASARQMPPSSARGSIKVLMVWETKALNGGALTAYRVCELSEDPDGYPFQPVPQLEKYHLDLENMSESESAQKLAQLAGTEKLPSFTAPIHNGEAYFGNLLTGLYVVMQKQADATQGYEPINPFLVAVPLFQNNGYDLHVVASPKVSPMPEVTDPTETEPTEPDVTLPPVPPPPVWDDSTLPQTGQLNWPIPLMAVCGLFMILIGKLILAGERKDTYEK